LRPPQDDMVEMDDIVKTQRGIVIRERNVVILSGGEAGVRDRT
jgi:hypothetical protein